MSDKVDWATMDTGWVDCIYRSGFTVGSNIGTGQLRARVLMGVLYLCGGVSGASGNPMQINQELLIAELPQVIKTAWRNGYTGITLNARANSGANSIRESVWTVVGSAEASGTREGWIGIDLSAAQGQPTIEVTWAQAAPCFGPIPHQG